MIPEIGNSSLNVECKTVFSLFLISELNKYE